MVLREAPSIEPRGRSRTPDADGDTSGARRAEARIFAGSTPARLTALAVALALVVLAAGAITMREVGGRQDTLHSLLADAEPLAYSAQRLYSALSVADAAAATAFLARGLEPTDVRANYSNAIAIASGEIVFASSGLAEGDATSRELLATVSEGLSVYTGLVETARANNRSGNPVGTSYLGSASAQMQTRILPAAQALHERQQERIAQIQRSYSSAPWLAISVPAAALLLLVAAQVFLAVRTRRRFTPALVVTTVATAVLLVWLMGAGLLSAVAAARAHAQGAGPLSELTAARISAQQARADETLGLVRRDGEDAYDADFDRLTADIGRLLAEYGEDGTRTVAIEEVDRASAAFSGWLDAHHRIREQLSTGQFQPAVDIATGPGPADSSATFDQLDSALGDAIEAARQTGRDSIGSASNALTALSGGAIVLTSVGVAGIVVGIWPRLREYR
ncbi:hypothetical protein DW322_20120 [Rhodococcus rhodnii]|uniref:Uncharacterized protein n=2 Tax=Rhodococcus rhodnii TaxID=38312 RepID=R7WRQ0_9NOCA|nr:hypothetical protein [Rhodococcus rhodnii]EOM77986.1 hypothetical protein Rrhod_0660 [Rhodococcus rhodnii LMG 5362]TXG92055.1 hypothetical protein DW322_20120 [Rhodococcus rhodnii]